MADGTSIEWTDATWNPITGCSVTSPGCTHCYAMSLAGTRMKDHPSRAGLTTMSKTGPVWTGEVRFNEQWLDQPLRWRKPRMIFVCAHGDLFHENVPDEWIDRVFAIMALCPQHVFQVLTKRPERMRDYLAERQSDWVTRWAAAAWRLRPRELRPDGNGQLLMRNHAKFPLPNVWLGVSVEDQTRADERRYPLNRLAELGWTTWVSYEPALGDVDWTGWAFIKWLVAGGESGDRARSPRPEWFRHARDWCASSGVAFLFKQWGEFLPVGQVLPGYGKVHGATAVVPGRMKLHYGGTPNQYPKQAFAEHGVKFASTNDGLLTFRVGKKAAGRLLDGVVHDGFPEIAHG